MTISEYRVQWTGGRIGEGFTVLHLGISGAGVPMAPVNTAIRNWFTALRATIPDDVNWVFPTEMRQFDEATGTLESVLPIPQATGLAGSAGGAYLSGVGRLVKWTTGSVVNGRRLVGHTYLVPSVASAGTDLGSISPTVITSDNVAHAALIAALAAESAPLVVWSRTGGTEAIVSSGSTLSRPTTMRRRND